MTRVDEFTSFYTSTSAGALRAAYALCGDRQVALDATVDAYRRAWRDWSKIRDRNPLGYVRTEAWKATALSRGTHPLRRRHEEDADTDLLDALGDLGVDDRRLIVLLTLGDTDLEQASREVGVPAEDGIEAVTQALDTLEERLGVPLEQLESRLRGLGTVTGQLEMPPADQVRQRARRGRRRNTVLLVVASVALVLGGGFVVTDGETLATQSALPYREKIGAERADVVLKAKEVSADNLLSGKQLAGLEPTDTWRTTSTDEDLTNDNPYATCPTTRFADDDPLRAFVRTFEASGIDASRAAQSIEVSRSDEEATRAYETTLGWYANCEHPRTQLVGSWVVKRPFGDFQIMRLRSHRSPQRTFTVGFTHSGSVTSTLVHERDGDSGPKISDFAQTLNDSVTKICRDSGGTCSNNVEVERTIPASTSSAPEFLGVVDLPPVADVDRVWSGIEPFTPEVNPAATLCEAADFSGDAVESTSSRVFVIPEADELPKEFGIAETVGTLGSDDDAKNFVADVRKGVEDCPDANLSAKVDQEREVGGAGYSGTVWRVGFEVNDDERVYYRMGIVRRGAAVAQVTFTPVDDYDISQKTFESLLERAGERLAYLPE